MESIEESNNIQKSWLTLRRRWLPALVVFSSVMTLTALVTFLKKPVYEAEGKLLLKPETTSATTTPGTDATSRTINALTDETSSTLDTEAEIIRSTPLVERTIATLKLKDPEGNLLKPDSFLDNLKVKKLKGTDIIKLSYRSTDPEEAANVVNQLMQVYLQNNVLTNRAEEVAARVFIEKQLPKAEANVQKISNALRQFKEQNRTVNLAEEAKAAVGLNSELEQQLTQAQGELAEANARAQALRDRVGLNPKQAMAVNSLSQSPGIQGALEEYQQVEGELAVALSIYQPAHPIVISLKEKLRALKSVLGNRVTQVVGRTAAPPEANLQAGSSQQKLNDEFVAAEVERLGLANQVTTLANKQKSFTQRLQTWPRLEQIQNELERKLGVAQLTYETLLKRLQDTSITENRNIGNVRTVAAATVPDDPVSPRKLLNFAIGIILGSLLAAGTTLLLEALDSSIKTVKETRDLFNYTVLGTIPLLKGAERIGRSEESEQPIPALPVRDHPRSAVSEAYRMLQASLKFLSSDTKVATIVVTSSVPMEGKSTVSANLALAIAELGHRVLLIDADMRRPSQHLVWEVPNTVGLSNVLVEEDDWQMAIRQEDDNLDILTSGVLPPNPVPLIDSNRMSSLMDTFRSTYDYVIIDTPPLTMTADALILGKKADGVLLVSRPGVVDAGAANITKQALHQSQQNVLGLVVNGVIPENEPYSYYRYSGKGYYSDAPVDRRLSAKAKDPHPGRSFDRMINH